MNIRKILFLLVVMAATTFASNAQNVAVKTNLLYDAGANINLGAEFKLAPKWSLDVSGDFNDWTINGHKWKHWFVQPEGRYWFCDAFAKHFLGFHAIGGQYNLGNIPKGVVKFLNSDFKKLKDHRYQGWGLGAGVAYGYAIPLAHHWNIEFEIGIGYVYFNYDIYECQSCGKKVGHNDHHYVGPTKAAVDIVYVF